MLCPLVEDIVSAMNIIRQSWKLVSLLLLLLYNQQLKPSHIKGIVRVLTISGFIRYST